MSQNSREAIQWENVRFRYPTASDNTLDNIDMTIREGEFVLLTGPTGCGKSTLLKTANGLIPGESSGYMEGCVSVFGQDTRTMPPEKLRSMVGLLFQNPDDQLLCTRVQEEVAFGPENLGLHPDLITNRVNEGLSWAGISEKRLTKCDELSGGEKQRVALASVLSMGNRLLALDEPTSQLDEEGTRLILQSLDDVRCKLNVTVIISEHRLDRILPMADRLVVMDQGTVRGDFSKGRFIDALPLLQDLGCEIPSWMALAAHKHLKGVEGEEAVCQHLSSSHLNLKYAGNGHTSPNTQTKKSLIRMESVTHTYSRAETPAIQSISCEVKAGEIIALMGRNGSGKSTLLALLAGLIAPREGFVEHFGENQSSRFPAGRVGLLFQNSDLMLSQETVANEVGLGARLLDLEEIRAKKAFDKSMALFHLGHLKNRNPYSLSQGERLRLALASLLAFDPQVLLLDEPTAGLDRGMRIRLLEDLRRWVRDKEMERAVVLSTHDTDAALAYADRFLILLRGKITATGPFKDIISGTNIGNTTLLETSPVLRIARKLKFPWLPRTTAALIEGIGDE